MSEYSASTCERLASELEAADKEMTPGPWTSKGYGFRSERRQIGFCHGFQDGTEDRLESGVIDAHGIAHLRNSAPEIAAALRAAVERVKELEAENRDARDALISAVEAHGHIGMHRRWLNALRATANDTSQPFSFKAMQDRYDEANERAREERSADERLAALEALVEEACDIAMRALKREPHIMEIDIPRISAIRAAKEAK